MRRQIARHLGAMVVLVAIASHTSAQLTDEQAAAAKAMGKLGGRRHRRRMSIFEDEGELWAS